MVLSCGFNVQTMGIVGFATRGFILQAHSVLARRTARLVVVSGGFM